MGQEFIWIYKDETYGWTGICSRQADYSNPRFYALVPKELGDRLEAARIEFDAAADACRAYVDSFKPES